MDKKSKKEIERIKDALAKAQLGTVEYRRLTEELKAFLECVEKESKVTSAIPGVSNETLASGVISSLLMGVVARVENSSTLFLPVGIKSLLHKIVTIRLK